MNSVDQVKRSLRRSTLAVFACFTCIVLLLVCAVQTGFISGRAMGISMLVLMVALAASITLISRRIGRKYKDSLPADPEARLKAFAMQENVASVICYAFGLLGPIAFLLMKPYKHNRTIRFHAFQSAMSYLAAIVVLRIMSGFDPKLSAMAWLVLLRSFLALLLSLLWLVLMYTAYRGKKLVLPVIGHIAERLA